MRGVLLALVLACSTDEPELKDDPGTGSCEVYCLEQEDTARGIIGTSVLPADEYADLCTSAPDTPDCEECFLWFHETFYNEWDITWACGCGLSTDDVLWCDPDADAEAALAECEEMCAANRLDLSGDTGS